MPPREPEMVTHLRGFALDTRQDVEEGVARARAVGQGGSLGGAADQIDMLVELVRRRQVDLEQMRRTYVAEVQLQKVRVQQRGRLVTNMMSHSTFGNAVRGTASRGRNAQEAQLSVEEAEVRNLVQTISLDLEGLLRELAREQRFISEMRSRTY